MTVASRPTVVIFCDHLLYLSETFIRAQAQALRQFSPAYAGSRRVAGLELPTGSCYTINPGNTAGKIREVVFKLFGKAPDLARRLHALDPVLVHAHFGPDGLRALPLSRQLRVPLIVTFHGSDATALNPRRGEASFSHRRYLAHRDVLQRGASLFLAVSEFIRGKLLEQGVPPEKVIVHYIGVDARFFLPTATGTEPVVLFVGRLSERNGPNYLIQAMAEVQKQHPEIELVLIGDGPLRKSLEQQAKASLRKYRFLGAQPPETIREWMDRASLFAASSVKINSGEEEAFGMVFAEAQAMQKPVVAFASGGVVEAVEHGQTGFLAPERNWRKMAEYLALLLRDGDLRRRFGIAGRQRVLRLFDLEKQTSVLEEIYSEVAAGRAPARRQKAMSMGEANLCHGS
jgi:colanic acid/amylovoran biosynthesis glycosyltransferase